MTYLAGEPVVPCAVCGTQIVRRGADGRGGLKYCGTACRAIGKRECERRRRGSSPKRADGICPRCNRNPRPPRPNGILRSWCKACETAQKADYMRSEAGRATAVRFRERHGLVKTEPVGECLRCGQQFSRRGAVGAASRKYCGAECSAIARRMLERQRRKNDQASH